MEASLDHASVLIMLMALPPSWVGSAGFRGSRRYSWRRAVEGHAGYIWGEIFQAARGWVWDLTRRGGT